VKLHTKFRKFASLTGAFLAIYPSLCAQQTDFLRSTGKIYSVVAVIAIVFIGIAIFLYRLDYKLTKLENQIKNEQ